MPDRQPTRILAAHDYGPRRFKWLTLKLLEWRDPTGRPRLWEMAERTTRPSCGVDAVAIVARALSAAAPPQIVLVSQYRPPVDGICFELPAGLIDAGEDAGAAALRELAEETGLTPTRLLSITPVCLSDPGLTNANMQLAMVEIDLDAPHNVGAAQRPDDGEAIEVHLAPWDGLLEWLMARKSEEGAHIDARLMSLAVGLQSAVVSKE